MPKGHLQKGSDTRPELEQNVLSRLIEASNKVPTAKKWISTKNTAIFPHNSKLGDLQSPVPTLEDLKRWTISELKACITRLDDGSLKVVPVNINSFAPKPHLSKASENFIRESLANQRSKLILIAFIRMRNMISNATGIPLYELVDINPLDEHATYRWVFSENYAKFPAKDLNNMSMDDLKRCMTALKSGGATVEKCSKSDLESDTNDQDSLRNNLSRSQDGTGKRLIEDIEKNLRLAVSKGRSKALAETSLEVLLNEGSIPHPKDATRIYRWKFTDKYPCFSSKKRNLWEWKSADLIKLGEAIDKRLLSFGLDASEEIIEFRDGHISKTPLTETGHDSSKLLTAMNETSAINLSTSPSPRVREADKSMQNAEVTERPTQSILSHVQTPDSANMNAKNLREEVTTSFPEHATHTTLSSMTLTERNLTLLNTTEDSFIKEVEDFIAREETTSNNVKDQVRTLMEEYQNSAASRKSQLLELSSRFVTLNYRAQGQMSEISRLHEQLDEEISNTDAVKREFHELKSEKDLWSKRMDEECKKVHEKGQREALDYEHRRQSVTSLVHLQEIQREKEKEFKKGQENIRQSMTSDHHLLNQELAKAHAEIERLRCGSTEAIDEIVRKIAKNHDCDNDRSKHELRTIVTNWRINENFFDENKIIPLGTKASTNFCRFLAKLSKEVSDQLLALNLLRAAKEQRIQNHAAPQLFHITESDVKKTLEEFEHRRSNSVALTPINSNTPRSATSPGSCQLKPFTSKSTLQPVTTISSLSHKSGGHNPTLESSGNSVAGIKRALSDDDEDIYGVSPPRAKRPAHYEKLGEMVERNRIRHGGLGGGEKL